MNYRNIYHGISIFIIIATLSSCGGVKHAEMIMFDDLNAELTDIDSQPILQIRADDIIGITVASRNQETVQAFQQQLQLQGITGEQALNSLNGYRVDEDGLIYLPLLGPIMAGGKTISQLRNDLNDQLVKYIPDASVQVRFVNFRVTLLGEVTRPNTYTIPNERLNVIEAIGMAGDFTPYARRDRVLVIRERGEIRETVRLNTQNKNIFQSPYFYLQPNDIVYVQPLKARQYATQGDLVNRYSGVLYPLFTLATLIVTIVK